MNAQSHRSAGSALFAFLSGDLRINLKCMIWDLVSPSPSGVPARSGLENTRESDGKSPGFVRATHDPACRRVPRWDGQYWLVKELPRSFTEPID